MHTCKQSELAGHLTLLALSLALRDRDPQIRAEARDALEELNQVIRRECNLVTLGQSRFQGAPVWG
jgi:hypothetical protein